MRKNKTRFEKNIIDGMVGSARFRVCTFIRCLPNLILLVVADLISILMMNKNGLKIVCILGGMMDYMNPD